MFKSANSRFVLAFMVAALAVASDDSGSPPAAAPAGPVLLAEVRARGIAGELGVPLGMIVTVHAVIVSGNSLRTKAAAGKLFSRVDRVGGQPLKPPALLELSLHPFAKEKLVQPVPNQVLTLTGWETGFYEGIVDDEFNYVSLYASDRYSFRTCFKVVKISK